MNNNITLALFLIFPLFSSVNLVLAKIGETCDCDKITQDIEDLTQHTQDLTNKTKELSLAEDALRMNLDILNLV